MQGKSLIHARNGEVIGSMIQWSVSLPTIGCFPDDNTHEGKPQVLY